MFNNSVTLKSLKMFLSSIEDFDNPILNLEQYSTPFDIAAVFINSLSNRILNKRVIDICCGPGILGIAAAVFHPKSLLFVDISPEAILILKRNLIKLNSFCRELPNVSILQQDFCNEFNSNTFKDTLIGVEEKEYLFDIALINPPFNTKNISNNKVLSKKTSQKKGTSKFIKLEVKEGVDCKIIRNALKISKEVYFFHSSSATNFLLKKFSDFKIKVVFETEFQLKKTMKFHKKGVTGIGVSIFRVSADRY